MKRAVCTFILAVALASVAGAQALKPGDLAFTSFNADQDGWALVALVDLAPQTSVYFTDNAWTASGGFSAGGGYERWVSGSGTVSAGTVVTFNYIDDAWKMQASVGTLTRETVAGSSYLNLSQTAGTLYAYQGASAVQPSVFITAISNGGYDAAVGALAGTGLAAGSNAVLLPAGADFAEFAGSRTAKLSVDSYRSLLNSTGGWSAADGGQYAAQISNAAPLASLVVPEPGALLLVMAGAMTLAVTQRTGRGWARLHRAMTIRSGWGGAVPQRAHPLCPSSCRSSPVRADRATPSFRGFRVHMDHFTAPVALRSVTAGDDTLYPRSA